MEFKTFHTFTDSSFLKVKIFAIFIIINFTFVSVVQLNLPNEAFRKNQHQMILKISSQVLKSEENLIFLQIRGRVEEFHLMESMNFRPRFKCENYLEKIINGMRQYLVTCFCNRGHCLDCH